MRRFLKMHEWNLLVAVTVGMICAPAVMAQQEWLQPTAPVQDGRTWEQVYEFSSETTSGKTLKVATELGAVKVVPIDEEAVRVRITVRVQAHTRARAMAALESVRFGGRQVRDGILVSGEVRDFQHSRRVWMDVGIEAQVPRSYNVQVETKAGNLQLGAVGGKLRAVTAAGNVSVQKVDRRASVVTAGGNIEVGEAGENVELQTAGGIIYVGKVTGDARLETSGGFITGGSIGGSIEAVTAGGDIVFETVGGPVTARTLGGQIRIGRSGGRIQAQSNGGSVVVVGGGRGGAQVSTAGGSIDLMEVTGPVRAVTNAGRILALIRATQADFGPSELETLLGDVVVYLPENLAVSIEASIEGGTGHRIRSDFPLEIRNSQVQAQGTVRGRGEINGGGERLVIRTNGGDIRILKLTQEARARLEQQTQRMRDHIQRLVRARLVRIVTVEVNTSGDHHDDKKDKKKDEPHENR